MAAHKRLNREEMISTALSVTDAEGLDAVTIRRVAQRHEATPMALYRHFSDKEGLLDALAERLLSEVRPPEPDTRVWDEQLRDLLRSFHQALRPHPNAAGLVLSRILLSHAGLALAERVLAILAEAGLPVEQGAETGSQALCSLVTLVITEPGQNHLQDPEARDDALRARRASLLSLSPHRFPHIVAAAEVLTCCASEEIYYERGINLIITGIRGLMASGAAPSV